MPSGRSIFALAVVVALLCGNPARALVHFDFEQKYFNEPPVAVLDHCVVEDNGIFHLFYLRGDPAVNIGHATTTDFVHWQLQPPILSPGTWDNLALWAPTLLKVNGNWHLFYTGVNQYLSQQSGVAFSSDLYNWFKLPWPIYRPSSSWAEWTETGFAHGRDPHVIAYNGKYYQFITAKTFTNEGAVGLAESTDLINWTDIGPAYVHNTWHVLESVFVMEKGGKWHMLFTEEAVNGTSHITSETSPLTGWDFSTRRIIDIGHAPQILTTSDGAELFSRHAVYNNYNGEQFHTIRFDTLAWVGDVPAPVKPWPLAADWSVVSGSAFALQPIFRNNALARGANVASTFEGDSWINTYESYTGPMGFGSVGQYQGDAPTGMIRSRPFIVTGNSMNLLVGGGSYPDECYVALVESGTGAVLYRETGNNVDEMDRRYWDLVPHVGKTVYLEIADLSSAVFGHINVDDIAESDEILDPSGTGSVKDRPGREKVASATSLGSLFQNTPNPFNPTTTIAYELEAPGVALIEVFDVSGARVRTLASGPTTAGTHNVVWRADNGAGERVKSGIYFYRLTVDGVPVATRKMVLLK